MTADQGSTGRQRTVAELLEQYGMEGRVGGRRRRRAGRAAQPAEKHTEQKPESPARAKPRESPAPSEEPGASSSSWSAFDKPDAPDTPSGTGTFDTRNGAYRSADSNNQGEQREPSPRAPSSTREFVTGTSPFTGTGIYQAASYGSTYQSTHQGIYQNGVYQNDSGTTASTQRPEQPTEQLPRYRDLPGDSTEQAGKRVSSDAGGAAEQAKASTEAITAARDSAETEMMAAVADTGQAPALSAERDREDDGGPSTEVASRAALFDDEPEPEGEGTGKSTAESTVAISPAKEDEDSAQQGRARRSRKGSREARDVPAGLEDEDELDEQEFNLKAWAVLVAQGVLGAIGGAVMWVGFRYLWLHFPVLALAAAVVATAGLVLVVRAIRGSEDLRTTMLAVLVGLIVTISPAVLLLTSVR